MPVIHRPNINIVAGGMLRVGTPIEDYIADLGIYVKREDLSCPHPGPPFSKARGVYAWVQKRNEKIIGVLDTSHSQAGWAVARACQVLKKKCINYYPAFKDNPGPHPAQLKAKMLGAELMPIPAGRSSILYWKARTDCLQKSGAMIPNALKLEESVTETALEVPDDDFDFVLIPASSGTIAAGVISGFADKGRYPTFIIHLGYTRSQDEVAKYLEKMSGVSSPNLEIIDEGYAYKDMAKPGPTPPWPCNSYYDLKTFRWWMANREGYEDKKVLMWNIG